MAADDHEWEAPVYGRAQAGGLGCPFCAGRRVVPRDSITQMRPDLLAEWDWHANGDLTPDQVRPGSSQVVWWTCPHGGDHRWRTPASSRNAGTGCPYCAGQLPSANYNLGICFPDVAAEWH